MAALISVVLPAYNAAATLEQTLASLARQTCRDFEVVLVDDCSRDATLAVAQRFAPQLRLKLLRNDHNLGVARTLNRALQEAEGEFIARLDADDLAQPTRLQRQLEVLREQPQLDVLGSHMVMFQAGADDDIHTVRPLGMLAHPLADAAIKTALVQRNVLSHPSLMIRRRFFDEVGLYNPALDFAEDYDLWCRGALLGKRYANLPEALTWYRLHGGQVSHSKAQLQFERDVEVRRRYLTALLGDTPVAQLPQLLAGATRYDSREQAAQAIVDSSAALVMLGARVRDAAEYATLVKACLQRHLLGPRPATAATATAARGVPA
jgi:glycosyltransferase involved in cell wall biosynthesis